MKPTSALVRASENNKKISTESYLKFQLDPHTSAVFAMRHVLEAMTLPAHQLTLMPNSVPCMIGLMNRRSRVLWVINLMHLLGMTPPDTYTQHYNLIIIQVNSIPLALSVHHVNGILNIEKPNIQPPPGHISSAIVPYLSGCIFQKKTMSLVLDATAIVNSQHLRKF
ncbi:MAG: chemotaxis protein CheW [Leptolyngbyaceae bacterium]|nr:chemotaxis protein CheW [Leptolyngbyaceae bacterium]